MTRTTRPLHRVAAATCTLAAALAVGLGAVSTVAPAAAAPVVTPMRTQAPGPGELQAKLQVALNRGAAPTARAAELEAGAAGLPLVDQVAAAMDAAPPSFRWSILGPVTVNGDVLSAQLQTAVDGYDPFYYTLTWRQIDGTWKLTREAQCTVASVAFLPCTV